MSAARTWVRRWFPGGPVLPGVLGRRTTRTAAEVGHRPDGGPGVGDDARVDDAHAQPITTFTAIRLRADAVAFGVRQMVTARFALARRREVGFFRVFGSGTRGFHPAPHWQVYAVLATWPSMAIAEHGLRTIPAMMAYRRRAEAVWTGIMRTDRCTGGWGGRRPFAVTTGQPAGDGPVAVLTRADVRLTRLPAFWREVPAISAGIDAQPGLRFRIGLGEVPWFSQTTFSLWDDARCMRSFAGHGAHGNAARVACAGGWFNELLFARFSLLRSEGDPAAIHATD